MKSQAMAAIFGFDVEEELVSIYPFSPVYRIRNSQGEFILKKTQTPISKANRLMMYTKNLGEKGINVVVPASIATKNPKSIEDVCYVVYPFIEGAPYSGKSVEIKEAGRLLGKIHALSAAENKFALDTYNVYDFTEAEAKESFKRIRRNADLHGGVITPKLEVLLMRAVQQQEELKQTGLTCVATPHDYKANNLIYTPAPYLIDPDNAAWVPRIFDLALVLLLFHNELTTAPNRPFTINEWNLFLSGYKEFVVLTELEKTYWSKALEHIFLDEVMWLMADVEEEWQNPAQRSLFMRLTALILNLDSYRLTEA